MKGEETEAEDQAKPGDEESQVMAPGGLPPALFPQLLRRTGLIP